MARRSLVRRLAFGLLPIVILAAGAVTMAGLVMTKPKLAPVPVEEKVWTVRAQAATSTDVRPELLFYGETVAAREVELRPLVGGRVVSVSPSLKSGVAVKAGEVLLEIDPFDYEIALANARANLVEAEAALAELSTDIEANQAMLAEQETQQDLRERDEQRLSSLRARGAASSKALDDSRMALLDTKSRLIERKFAVQRLLSNKARQEAVIDRAKIEVRRALHNLEQTKLTAPFDGNLTDIGIELGKQVTQGDRVARLIDTSRMDVSFHVSTRHFGELLADGPVTGRKVQVVWQVQGAPQHFSGAITRTGPEIDATSGGVEFFAELSGISETGTLRPGAFVEVRMDGRKHLNVVRLPEAAWHDGLVYAIDGGKLHARKASLVRRLGQEVLIRGAFGAGDLILVTPIPAATAGMRVRVADGGA